MASTELAFETLSGAIESVHGTAIAAPTHIFNLTGMITPVRTRTRRGQSDGNLAEFRRSVETRAIGSWEGSGDLDVNILPFFLEMGVKGGGTHALVGGGTLANTHTYVPTQTSDDLKSATLWFGDPNIQTFQGAYAMLDSLTISNDASSTDGATMSVKGTCLAPSKVSAPTQPTLTTGGLIAGTYMIVSVDTSSAIGTTPLVGTVISAEHTLNTGLTYKYLAQGSSSNLGYVRHGRMKTHLETKITVEVPDMTLYDYYVAGTTLKVRVTHQGTPYIEGTTRPYVVVDTYGPLADLALGDLEGSNRTYTFTIISEYDATLGASYRFQVRNGLAALV